MRLDNCCSDSFGGYGLDEVLIIFARPGEALADRLVHTL
jgi:hypothetical protein